MSLVLILYTLGEGGRGESIYLGRKRVNENNTLH